MEVLRVSNVIPEARNIATVMIEPKDIARFKALRPGQFVMVWVPGVDEVPMSVSFLGGSPFSLGMTVQDIGEATHALCSLEKGDLIGIRGPYGKGFRFPRSPEGWMVIGVSGGVGTASTILAMEEASRRGLRTVELVGARDNGSLLFRGRWERSSSDVRYITDDGSSGRQGFVTDLLREAIGPLTSDERRRTMVLTCGPEPMLVSVRDLLKGSGIGCQFSLERFMKCGIGVCDSCSLSGHRVCQDGPVFALSQVLRMEEMGMFHRDRSGRKVPLKECVR
jgi:dihydroorotate dehydrogenase electron transfer subunit